MVRVGVRIRIKVRVRDRDRDRDRVAHWGGTVGACGDTGGGVSAA